MTNKEFFISCWQSDAKSTLSALRGLPAEVTSLDYKPNELARSAHEIISHILPHAEGMLNSIDTHEIPEAPKNFTDATEAHDYYEKISAEMIEKLQTVSDERWETEMIALTAGGMQIFEKTMRDMFWTMMFDTIHHRGQLSTYYRAMGMRNPQIYGPTAEDMAEMMASMQAQN